MCNIVKSEDEINAFITERLSTALEDKKAIVLVGGKKKLNNFSLKIIYRPLSLLSIIQILQIFMMFQRMFLILKKEKLI